MASTSARPRYPITVKLGSFEKALLEETLVWMRAETPHPGARYADVEAAILKNLQRLPEASSSRLELTLNQARILLQSLTWLSAEATAPTARVRKAEDNIRHKLSSALNSTE
jgi:hypothetical protein